MVSPVKRRPVPNEAAGVPDDEWFNCRMLVTIAVAASSVVA